MLVYARLMQVSSTLHSESKCKRRIARIGVYSEIEQTISVGFRGVYESRMITRRCNRYVGREAPTEARRMHHGKRMYRQRATSRCADIYRDVCSGCTLRRTVSADRKRRKIVEARGALAACHRVEHRQVL